MSTTAIATIKEQTVDAVQLRIEAMQKEGGIHLPPNYSPQNALRSAWLTLQEVQTMDKKPALEVCTRESVVNALLDTVIQGLSPAKKQVYYIPYGKKLVAQRSYHGTRAVTKRLSGVKDVVAQVVYKGDEFVYEINGGVISVVKHAQSFDNLGGDIVAAYCVISFDDGRVPYAEIMNKKQINTAWSKSQMKHNQVQKDFSEEMAMRSVINRACKRYWNTSDDSDLSMEAVDAFNRTEDVDAEAVADVVVAENANAIIIDADAVASVEPPPPPPAPDESTAPTEPQGSLFADDKAGAANVPF